MTAVAMLELKQRLAKLNATQRREIAAYISQLLHQSPAARRENTRIMREMDKGRKFPLRDYVKP